MTLHDLSAELSDVPLLPARDAVLARLAEQLAGRPAESSGSGTLLVIGLLRRDDGWPLSERTRDAVTTLLARSMRGEDWFGSSGDTEFAVLTSAPPVAAVSMAERLVAGIARLGVAGLCGAAGLVPLAARRRCRRAAAPGDRRAHERAPHRARHRRALPRAGGHPVQLVRRSTAVAIRSSVAVSAMRTCRAPAGP